MLKKIKKTLKKGFSLVRNKKDFNRKKEDVIKNDEDQAIAERELLNSLGRKILSRQLNELTNIEIVKNINQFEKKPKISIVIPIYNPNISLLDVAINSIITQTYSNWELCLYDDGSKNFHNVEALISNHQDERIRFSSGGFNKGIAEATNSAIEMSSGEYVLFMDQDDILAHEALYWIINEINKTDDADLYYSDECKVSADGGEFFDFFFKPDWSPTMMLNSHYVGHLSICKASVIEEIGGFKKEFDFSQDYDFVLRLMSEGKKIRHIERVLYFWRAISGSAASGGKDYARTTNIKALNAYFGREKIDCYAYPGKYANEPYFTAVHNQHVSIVIPSDNIDNIKRSVSGILTNTSYRNYEIKVVTNSQIANLCECEFASMENVYMVRYDKPYNFSDKCNVGAKSSKGEIIVFYNDDVYPNHDSWLDRLLDTFALPWVGAASPKLLFEDGRIQYAGMISGTPGLVGTSFNCMKADGIQGTPMHPNLLRDISVLSGAVTAIKRDLFNKIGGFDALNTPNRASDVDLSYKVLASGFNCVYTPYSILTHIGNHSWHEPKKKEKSDIYCLNRWSKYVSHDPYFTYSMKQFLYHDFNFEYKIFSPNSEKIVKRTKKSKDVLIITHELTLTGAPIALLSLCKDIIQCGDVPVLISPKDGPLRQEFTRYGINVIIDESIINGHWIFKQQYQNFDLVIANTLAVGSAVKSLNNSLTDVYWWIHECQLAFDIFKSQLPESLGSNITIIPVSEYVTKLIKKNTKYHIWHKAVPATVEDQYQEFEKYNPYSIPTFLIIGTIEYRKAQDIVIDAIHKLNESNLCNLPSKFIFYGKCADDNICRQIQESKKIGQAIIEYGGIVDHNTLLREIKKSVAIIVPSRDEPLSLVAIESFMLGKVCIISSNCGIVSYCKNKEDSISFENENAAMLSEIIRDVIEGKINMDPICKKARELYKNKFSHQDSRNFY